jgi:hypothetical protein
MPVPVRSAAYRPAHSPPQGSYSVIPERLAAEKKASVMGVVSRVCVLAILRQGCGTVGDQVWWGGWGRRDPWVMLSVYAPRR